MKGRGRARNYRLFLVSASVETAGDSVFRTVVPVLAILSLNADPMLLGVINAMGTAAFLLLGPQAGVFVDRLPPKPVMIVSSLTRAICIALFACVAIAFAGSTWMLLVTVAAVSAADVIFTTASSKLLPSLVGPRFVSRATEKMMSFTTLVAIAFPAIAGFFIDHQGPFIAAFIAVCAYALSALSIGLVNFRIASPWTPDSRPVKSREETRTPFFDELRNGFRFLVGDPVIKALMASNLLFNAAAAFSAVLLPLLAFDVLGMTAAQLGVGLASGGLGAFLAASVAGAIIKAVGGERSKALDRSGCGCRPRHPSGEHARRTG